VRARVVLIALFLLGLHRPAAADDTITIGLYAPTAPFDGSADRVGFVTELADHLAGDGGARVSGKVYSSASAFASAVKKGEIEYAVVDAPYAAALGLPYKVLGAAVRDGAATASWQLVAGKGVSDLGDLAGKKVAVPSTGARAAAFVVNALLGGEVEASYFAKILEAADSRSALTMVSVGKADAALVPDGVDLPAGLSKVTSLDSIGWPMFVALPGAGDADTRRIKARLVRFSSSRTFTGFTDADAGRYRDLAGRFARTAKRGPMAVPPVRLSVRDLLGHRSFVIPSSNVLDLIEAPRKK
jgi:ABC-type amino acid transport substrate-binding protein